jgi:hypothetical protein
LKAQQSKHGGTLLRVALWLLRLEIHTNPSHPGQKAILERQPRRQQQADEPHNPLQQIGTWLAMIDIVIFKDQMFGSFARFEQISHNNALLSMAGITTKQAGYSGATLWQSAGK